jgi:hypothetical protein
MTTPDFNDLTPPHDLTREWFRCDSSRVTLENHWRHIATEAARWGARHGWEQARQPSLQELALKVLSGLEKRCDLQCDLGLIRRALEQAGEGQA